MKKCALNFSTAVAIALSILAVNPIAAKSAPLSVATQPFVNVADLPLHFIGGGHHDSHTIAVYLTGDGGWADFDKRVCASLARRGIPTVAIDTNSYFSDMRTPEEASQALARAIRAGMSLWNAERVIVVGYSFGADVAPFLINRLPDELRSHIDRLALMGPSAEAPFQVTLSEQVGLTQPGKRPVLPELTRASKSGVNIACLYGENDGNAICPALKLTTLKTYKLPGGHGFHDDDNAVAEAITNSWPLLK